MENLRSGPMPMVSKENHVFKMAANTEKCPEQVVQEKTSLPYQSRRMHALAQLKPKREKKERYRSVMVFVQQMTLIDLVFAQNA